MSHVDPSGENVGQVWQVSLPRYGRHRSSAGLHLGDHAGGNDGPDDVVAAVVLAADPVVIVPSVTFASGNDCATTMARWFDHGDAGPCGFVIRYASNGCYANRIAYRLIRSRNQLGQLPAGGQDGKDSELEHQRHVGAFG